MTLDETVKEAQKWLGFKPWTLERAALYFLTKYKQEKDLNKAELDDNEPLTWEELKVMIGEPVWIEVIYPEEIYSHWVMIQGFTVTNAMIVDGFNELAEDMLDADDFGTIWNAYRHKRTDGDS